MVLPNYQLGFSAAQQGEFNALPIQGKIPEWLRGSLIRTGPGTLQVGKQSYHHWFDGLAMLRKYKRELIASVPVKQPAYMHTFAMTQHYIILSEFPLVLNCLSLMLSGKPYIENYQWKPALGTRFLVIDKADGTVVHTCYSESFVAFHHVNAFEQDDEIVVDLIAYPDASVIQSLYLESLLHHPEQVVAAGELRRYHLPLKEQVSYYEVLTSEPIELPRINYQRCNTHLYQFVYGVGSSQPGHFIDQLIKTDVQNGTTQIWHSPNCYPGEPVFVASPNATFEYEGAILSVVLNATRNNSFLLLLDACSWREIDRLELPYYLPFDLHGQYFDAIVPTQRTQLHR